ncbi:MAG: hypothetical protein ACREKS_05575 [Candidatus Rokuibacteriota bacterium]
MSQGPPTGEAEKARWDLRVTKAEFWYKVGIMTIGAIAMATFIVYQHRQTESRYYADLMSQRETADSQLRAEMFKTLFDAYFKSKIQPEGGDGSALFVTLKNLRQEVMLSDLLARNFESIDIRPLFEDLNTRLTRVIQAGDRPSAGPPSSEQFLAFRQREELRRVAIGATARQVAALEALQGSAQARVSYHTVTYPCLGAKRGESARIQWRPDLPKVIDYGVTIEDVKDGVILMRLVRAEPNQPGTSSLLSVSFFDMPALENIYLANGERAAFSLYYYLSQEACQRFRGALDDHLQANCIDFERGQRDYCGVAQFRTVILPRNFMGVHDRPYVNDLAGGRYREPWWKLW